MSAFPDARYLIAASRLRPGLDGGYTVATLQRAQLFQDAGADLELLTFDPAPAGDSLAGFIALGLADERTRLRNLFDELREDPEMLRTADLHPISEQGAADTADDRSTLIAAADGSPLLRLPYVPRIDWHRSEAEIPVFAADGSTLGALHGFGELYRFWVDQVVAETTTSRAERRPVVLISEAKQLGELLVAGPRDYALVHTVHNAHTEAPHAWDSEITTLWSGWFDTIDRYDGVIWLTSAQRADAVRRFGEHPNWVVIAYPARAHAAESPELSPRDAHRAIMIARLVPQKRVEDAVRAWPAVLAADPEARLDIYGDGPQRAELEALIVELGLVGHVVLHGYVPRVSEQLTTAAVVLLTSRYEGRPLAVVEALSAGTPVIAYDIPYGPAEMIEVGVSGALVLAGDTVALAAALAQVLGNPERIAALSAGAHAWAREHSVDRARAETADFVRSAIENWRAGERVSSQRGTTDTVLRRPNG